MMGIERVRIPNGRLGDAQIDIREPTVLQTLARVQVADLNGIAPLALRSVDPSAPYTRPDRCCEAGRQRDQHGDHDEPGAVGEQRQRGQLLDLDAVERDSGRAGVEGREAQDRLRRIGGEGAAARQIDVEGVGRRIVLDRRLEERGRPDDIDLGIARRRSSPRAEPSSVPIPGSRQAAPTVSSGADRSAWPETS